VWIAEGVVGASCCCDTPLGYLLASTVLLLNLLIGIVVVAQTVSQMLMGIPLSVGQFVLFVGSFVALSLFATWLTLVFFRSISESAPYTPARVQLAQA